MYKYLRDMMDLADLVGDVDDILMGDWGKGCKILSLEGKQADGRPFKLRLELEVEDGT